MQRDELVQFKASEQEKLTLKAAAERRGLTLSAWLRLIGLQVAKAESAEADAAPGQ